ncbi:uncharacterized protein LOC108904144 [Anoplophora glabripennis]|uniref:uncharacterized protein LOC108904144 n=1 Tax=Anoplophora glabripennis TaxID=217634 RepID=UPI000873E61C|nr:uncharacterized protein LOC108904144 [Anoplophora glabripennis]
MSVMVNYSVLLFVFILPCDSFTILNKGDKCSLQDGVGGKCKLIKECPTAMQLIETGVFPVICGYEGTESIVCCKEDEGSENYQYHHDT